ncbi:hypothetical protein [Oceanicola sp. 22II-s10i]|uniref:hypothetical protein n=1 Tax=Oceanicola sp. 22II-s10i TaxID=1317116 RepID=UPI001595A6D7|nr:hypothetical protein [Oceanicola sp. 22II-s10i]
MEWTVIALIAVVTAVAIILKRALGGTPGGDGATPPLERDGGENRGGADSHADRP